MEREKIYTDEELEALAKEIPETRFLVQQLKFAQNNVKLSRRPVVSVIIIFICIVLMVVLLILNIILS